MGSSLLRRRRLAIVAAVVVSSLALGAEVGAYPRPGKTYRVSVASDGSQSEPLVPGGTVTSWFPSMSKDGRFVAFSSAATNFIPNKLGSGPGIYVRDRKTGTTEPVSKTSAGEILGGASPSISASGRFVAFTANKLAPNDLNAVNDIYVYDRKAKTTKLVSVSDDEKSANGESTNPSISPNGRYVAFASAATNLVDDGDTGPEPPPIGFIFAEREIFLRDLKKKTTVRVSVPLDGGEANGNSTWPSVSSKGPVVVFTSTASNLVAGDLGGDDSDVFVRNMDTRTTEMLSSPANSVAELARPGVGTAIPYGGRAISSNGRFVTFSSNDSNLVPHDGNGGLAIPASDIFVHDRRTDRTDRVSVTSIGHESNGSSRDATISQDGRYVSFSSFADNLSNKESEIRNPQIPHDGDPDFFVYDRVTGAVEWISVTPRGTEAESCLMYDSALGGSGRYVAFSTCASDIVPNDTNRSPDVFVRDRGSVTGVGALGAGRGVPSRASGTFRKSGIVRLDDADDDSLVPALESSELVGASLVHRPAHGDLFARIDLESLSRLVPAAGSPGIRASLTYGLRLRVDGRRYEMRAEVSPAGERYALFRCAGSCVEVGVVPGAYGTVGDAIVAAIPLQMMPPSRASRRPIVTGVEAFVATGDHGAGSRVEFDEARA